MILDGVLIALGVGAAAFSFYAAWRVVRAARGIDDERIAERRGWKRAVVQVGVRARDAVTRDDS